MIKPPQTYSEWVEVFNILKAKTDDSAVLHALQNGTIHWQEGVADRFIKRLIDAINARMSVASNKFQKDLNNARGHEGHIIQALLTLRKEMEFLSKAVNLPTIPSEKREQYYRLVRNQADRIQSSLEDSAKVDRTGKTTIIVRNYKVNSF